MTARENPQSAAARKPAAETQRESAEKEKSRVTLARIVRPRGIKGEVAAEILTDFPARLPTLREVLLWNGQEAPRAARVRRCWLSPSRGGQAIFHFEGVDSVADARSLVGCDVQVPLSERVALPGGMYFVTDLIGCEVEEVREVKEVKEVEEVKELGYVKHEESFTSLASSTSSTSLLGVVRDVQPLGDDRRGTPLLVVQGKRGELLIPLAHDICVRIDVAARRIAVILPEGLRDLNRQGPGESRSRPGP
jgi:16S rRNA processing protein RimM